MVVLARTLVKVTCDPLYTAREGRNIISYGDKLLNTLFRVFIKVVTNIFSLLCTLTTHNRSIFDCIPARQNPHLFPQCSHFFPERVHGTNHVSEPLLYFPIP